MSINKNDPKMKALMDMQKDLDPIFNKAKFRSLGKKRSLKQQGSSQDDYIGYLLDDLQPGQACNDLTEWSDQSSDDFLD
jgi:hypothetical protein